MSPYNSISKIGKGGFGDVYKVSDCNGDFFAQKIYRDPQLDGVDSDIIRKRFEREVRYQSNIKNPYIINILDHDLNTDPPYYIMELADCSLGDEIKADHTLSNNPDQALFDILAGLEAIHSIGITHRDLKPDNVLKITNDDGTFRYALSDFGLMTASQSDTTTITQTNMAGGSTYYAPPECSSNFKKATHQSDIYSFGAILHDIYCHGQSRIPYSQLSGSGEIGKVIERCPKSNTLRRYNDVAELRNALYNALRHAPATVLGNEDQTIVNLLESENPLTDDDWDKIYFRLDDNEDKNISNSAIFQYLKTSHIEELSQNSPSLLNGIGKMYCDHVYSGTFDFNYCDILAQKLQHFFTEGGVELKAIALISLLKLGNSHHRWYVLRTFASLATLRLSDQVITRFDLECDARRFDVGHHISQLLQTISVNPTDLHLGLIDRSED